MDKEVRKDNMIPGSCEEFTRPEEIKALSKYLRTIKKDLEDSTYLMHDNLELFGRKDGRAMKKIDDLPNIVERVQKGDHPEVTEIIGHKETLNLKNTLEKLPGDKVSLDNVNQDTPLSDHIETIDVKENPSLERKVEPLGDTTDEVSLEKEKVLLEDKSEAKLSDHRTILPDTEQDIVLEKGNTTLPEDVSLQEHAQFDPERDSLYDANIARPDGENNVKEALEDYVAPIKGKIENPELHDDSTRSKISPPEGVRLHDDSTKSKIQPSPEEAKLHDDSTISRIEDKQEVNLHDDSTVSRIKDNLEAELHDDSIISPIVGAVPKPELSEVREDIVGKVSTPELHDESTITKIQPSPEEAKLHDLSTITPIKSGPVDPELHDSSTITSIQPKPEEPELHDLSTITPIKPGPIDPELHDLSTITPIKPGPVDPELHDESTRTSVSDNASGEHAQFNPDSDSLYDSNIILPGNLVNPDLHDESVISKIKPGPEEVELHDESTKSKIEPEPKEVELHDESVVTKIEPGPGEPELHDSSTITEIFPKPIDPELHDESVVTKIEPGPEEVDLHDESVVTKIEPGPVDPELHDSSTITEIFPKPIDPELHDESVVTKIEPGPEGVELHDESTKSKIEPGPSEPELEGESSISKIEIPDRLETDVWVKFDPNINTHTARTSGLPSENPEGWKETLDDFVESIVGEVQDDIALQDTTVTLNDTSPEEVLPDKLEDNLLEIDDNSDYYWNLKRKKKLEGWIEERKREVELDKTRVAGIPAPTGSIADSPEKVEKKILENNILKVKKDKFKAYWDLKRRKRLEGWKDERRRKIELDRTRVAGIPAPTNSLADGPVEDLIRDVSMLDDENLNVYYQNILNFAKTNAGKLGKWGAKARSILSALASSKMTEKDLEVFEQRLYGSLMLEDYVVRKEKKEDGEVKKDEEPKKKLEGDYLFREGMPLSNLPENYFNSAHGIGVSASNPSTYLRWVAERTVGDLLGHRKSGKISGAKSRLRQIALDETLALLVLARDKAERLTKGNRDRLPGNEGLLGDIGKLVSQGATEAVTSLAKKAVKGMFGANKLDYTVPQNRPAKKKETSSFIAMNDKGRDYSSEGIEGKEYNFNKEYLSGPLVYGINERLKVKSAIGGADNYVITTTSKVFPRAGIMTTLSELCGQENTSEVDTVDKLFNLLKNSPYISTAGKVTSSNEHPLKVSTLDSNMRWEIIFTPFVGIENGEMSFLPPIEEINVWNLVYHGIKTGYNYFAPINSFELGKSKLNSKTIPLFEGEISYPTAMEFTNELRLTFIDDQFKSWRTYFERCVDASIYNSTVHKKEDYDGTYDSLGKLTAIDKAYTCVAPYKNITFRCTIYSLTPQYSTISKYDLLLVMKDFTEERSGDVDAAGQDLVVSFSIVGENPRNSLSKVTVPDALKSKVYAPSRNNTRSGGYDSIINSGIDNMIRVL